jgi:hypothetical protein
VLTWHTHYRKCWYIFFYSTEGCVARGIDTSFGASAEKLTRAIPFAEGGVLKTLWAEARGKAFPHQKHRRFLYISSNRNNPELHFQVPAWKIEMRPYL